MQGNNCLWGCGCANSSVSRRGNPAWITSGCSRNLPALSTGHPQRRRSGNRGRYRRLLQTGLRPVRPVNSISLRAVVDSIAGHFTVADRFDSGRDEVCGIIRTGRVHGGLEACLRSKLVFLTRSAWRCRDRRRTVRLRSGCRDQSVGPEAVRRFPVQAIRAAHPSRPNRRR